LFICYDVGVFRNPHFLEMVRQLKFLMVLFFAMIADQFEENCAKKCENQSLNEAY
jgi:hypothetical protein